MKASRNPRRTGRWTLAGLLLVVIFLVTAYDVALFQSLSEERSTGPGQSSPRPSVPILSKRFPASFRMGSLDMTFKPGDSAPDISLPAVNGEAGFRLERFTGCKPYVLIFGNFTCDLFQSRLAALESFYRKHKDRAVFAFIAVNEAGHKIPGFEFLLEELPAAQPFEVRKLRVQKALKKAGLTIPAFIDLPDQPVSETYRGWPARLLVVDVRGKIARDFGSVVRNDWNWEQVARLLENCGTNETN